MLIKDKKGDLEPFALQMSWWVDIAMLILVIFVFYSVYNKITTSEIHNLKAAVRDFSFAHDAVISSPHEVFLSYRINDKVDMNFDMKECIVFAKSKEKKYALPSRFPCAKNSLVKSDSKILEGNIAVSKK